MKLLLTINIKKMFHSLFPLKPIKLISNPKIEISYKYHISTIAKIKFKLKDIDRQIKLSESHLKIYYCDYLVEDEVLVYYCSFGKPKTYEVRFFAVKRKLELINYKVMHNVRNSYICLKNNLNDVIFMKCLDPKKLKLEKRTHFYDSEIDFYNSKTYYVFKNGRYYVDDFSLYFLSDLPSDLELTEKEVLEEYVKVEVTDTEHQMVRVHFSDKIEEVPLPFLQQLQSEFIDNQLENLEEDVYVLNCDSEALDFKSFSFLRFLDFINSKIFSSFKKNFIYNSLKL